MFVFNFIVKTIKKIGRAVTYPCRKESSSTSEENRDLLLSNDAQHGYSAIQDDEEARISPTSIGLTSEYTGWGQTKAAALLCLFHITLYIALAIFGYSFLLEQWTLIDSIYFAIVIFTTVGYGDLSPTNDFSRMYTLALAFYGIVILGIFLGIVGEVIIEAQLESMERRMANTRVKVMEQFSTDNSSTGPVTRSFGRDLIVIFVKEIPILLVLIAIATPIIYNEGWDLIMGIYWMFVTASTVGFGDLGPTSELTRSLCILYIPISVCVMGEFLSRIAAAYLERRNDATEMQFMGRSMTKGDLNTMDTDEDGKVSRSEFLSYMLVALQKVEREDVDEVMALFEKLDASQTGFIEMNDLKNKYQFSTNSRDPSSATQPSPPRTTGGVSRGTA